jgi:hypothetical protein
MNGVGAGNFRGAQDIGNVTVAECAVGRSDADVLVGRADMERVGIDVRMDRNGTDAHLFAGPDDPECDLAAIGYEDFFEHGMTS